MLEEALRWLGFGLCHQLPERSYTVLGVQAPVCVRDTGIYLGFLISFWLIVLLHRGERRRGFPAPHVWAIMAVLLAFMGWDGVTSYAGLRETTNELRLITGLGVGFSAAALVVPMLNDELWSSSSSQRVLDPLWRLSVWLVAIPISWLLIGVLGVRLGVAFVLLIAGSILFTLAAVNLVIVGMLPAFDRRVTRLAGLPVPIGIALAIAMAEVYIAGVVRGLLIDLAARL